MNINYLLKDSEDHVTFDRWESEDYCLDMIKRALRSDMKIKITYPDGSAILFNPQEEGM